jgi:ABC-type nickel/cobalt efflux system permease component RcnA
VNLLWSLSKSILSGLTAVVLAGAVTVVVAPMFVKHPGVIGINLASFARRPEVVFAAMLIFAVAFWAVFRKS